MSTSFPGGKKDDEDKVRDRDKRSKRGGGRERREREQRLGWFLGWKPWKPASVRPPKTPFLFFLPSNKGDKGNGKQKGGGYGWWSRCHDYYHYYFDGGAVAFQG